MKVELLIQWLDTCYEPVTLDGITWTLERKGTPGKTESLPGRPGLPVPMEVNPGTCSYI